MKIKYKKRVRLKDFDYKGCCRYFVTICAYNKNPKFNNDKLVEWLVDILREKSLAFHFLIWAYCFMPDHLHILCEGQKSCSDMIKFIASYKQTSGFYYKKRWRSPLWQENFYEHVLRKEEDNLKVARYIFDNPVRKGLVEDFAKYKFLGSFEFDIR